MKVYAYMRYSTDRQEEHEQEVIINRYCQSHGLRIDKRVIDRAVSGSVSWENRNLADLVSKLQPGDVIICSEATRLSRSMSDFSQFLNSAMRKLSARIIVCNMGMDIDCSNLNALTEIQLQMLMFAAQFERELTIQRIKAAMDYRRHLIETEGGFISKSGVWRTSLGNTDSELASRAGKVSAQKRRKESLLYLDEGVMDLILKMKNDGINNVDIAITLNELGKRTARGGKFYGQTIKRLLLAYEEYGDKTETE